ncbi:MAG: type II toxin-antitoxin system VapC family toxin [Actinomycetota bacterium]|nr:type II toxin-antitoxin system VapC family toxin [Actinomycetota bacterium]
MGFLLDTNVVSELRKRDRHDARVRAWFDQHRDDEFWLSVLVVGELARGVQLIARRDAPAAEALRAWLDSVTTEFADRILPVTMPISLRWAALCVPDPLPVIDGLLAATALEHGLTLVTRNVADVARSGVPFVNPFD